MVHTPRGELERRQDILVLKVGKLREDFRFAHSRTKHLEYINHADAHPSYACASPALFGVDRYAFSQVHTADSSGRDVPRAL